MPGPRDILQSACGFQVCPRAQFVTEAAIIAKKNVEQWQGGRKAV